ncbi:MAG: primosomal protein N' [Actinomycetales bacterium]
MNDAAPAEALFGLPERVAQRRRPWTPAAELPVARVLVDIPLPHLDRPFDFAVPETMSEAAQPGVRVRVRFAGQLLNGWILERAAGSDHPGELAPLSAVVSPVPVLTPETAALARAVADRYAGTAADVLRLAIPPRHARGERAVWGESGASPAGAAAASGVDPCTADGTPLAVDGTGWRAYTGGGEWFGALAGGLPARAVAAVAPGDAWTELLAQAAVATVAAGRSAVLVVPDARDVTTLAAALAPRLASRLVVELRADLGPEARYRRWLRALQGQARVVLGTRAAVFAPVRELGLVAVWDDGDDLHAEPRAPYPHVREVAALRALQQDAALLVAGHTVTAQGLALTEQGWARLLTTPRERLRRLAPRVTVAGDDVERERDAHASVARLPSLAVRVARAALASGPVLVQVPRAGYVPAVACQQCRHPARCARCAGPLQLNPGTAACCGWCGSAQADWRCPECGSGRLRAALVGARRTAEELGRAFPGYPVVVSGRHGDGDVRAEVGPAPALVVATPGAEPVAEGGYAAALLLDGWLLLSRPELRASEEALRRWINAAALVRSGARDGHVVVMAPSEAAAVQALVRWDPVWLARRELADRREVHLPPAARVAEIVGPESSLLELGANLDLPPSAERLGPVPLAAGAVHQDAHEPAQARLLVRVPRSAGLALTAALRKEAAARSVRKDPVPLRARIDPHDFA